MKIEVFENPEQASLGAARFLAAEARESIVARGQFLAAFSGGISPWPMLEAWAGEKVPWENVQIGQVDERVAPADAPERNLPRLRKALQGSGLHSEQIHAMPVESTDLGSAVHNYALALQMIVGIPPALDLIHLGLGADGHTASLFPGDPVLEVVEADVALTRVWNGLRRMTFTLPMLNRARRLLWLVTGAEKAPVLASLVRGNASLPAGRVRQDNAILFADRAAAQMLPKSNHH
jgi:6-phosphogluconolactonase